MNLVDFENVMSVIERYIEDYVTLKRISDDIKEYVKD